MEALEILVCTIVVVSCSCALYLWGYRKGLDADVAIKSQKDNIRSEDFLEKRDRQGSDAPGIKLSSGEFFEKRRLSEHIIGNQYKKIPRGLRVNKDGILEVSTSISEEHTKKLREYNVSIISVLNSIDVVDGFFGEDVFSFCNGLKMAVIHGGDIGPGAFCFCRSLTKVAVLSGTERVGEGAFAYCKKLKYAFFADSVRKIGRGVFDGCDALEMVILPSQYFNGDGVLGEKMRIFMGLKASVACYRGQEGGKLWDRSQSEVLSIG